ncbi:glycosyltransferase family 2 protein [Hoylesella timonensis]|uniref:glycosyltransferase family 2 protein n=1 Tax=Hoylesella timonensis TaxID=386414 RepID=UPI00288A055D|nr:glycosyltransferase family 2 protein [Hoylesella timonensis]
MKKVTILIPCYNEAESLPLLYEHLKTLINGLTTYDWELFFINDGSKDETLSCLHNIRNKDNRACFISLSRNFGKERAMLSGFDYASGDCVIIMDADLQHPPKIIPEMLKHWEEGYQDVYARRTNRGKESFLRRRLSLLYYKVLDKMARYDVLQNVGDFRLLDRKCINALRKIRESQRYTKGIFCWIGYKKKAIDFEQQDRIAGNSAWSFTKLFSLAIDGLASSTTFPLHISTFLGIACAVLALVYMVFVFVKTMLIGEPVQGFPTLIIVILFLGGVQLLSLGIIGIYLGRIFNETKGRPIYLIDEAEGINVNE